jgi:hypothetical protein
MEYYSVIKRNKVQINIFKSPDETWKHAKWKKLDTEDHLLYDFVHMTCPQRQTQWKQKVG